MQIDKQIIIDRQIDIRYKMCCMQTETRTNTNLKMKSCCNENSNS